MIKLNDRKLTGFLAQHVSDWEVNDKVVSTNTWDKVKRYAYNTLTTNWKAPSSVIFV